MLSTTSTLTGLQDTIRVDPVLEARQESGTRFLGQLDAVTLCVESVSTNTGSKAPLGR